MSTKATVLRRFGPLCIRSYRPLVGVSDDEVGHQPTINVATISGVHCIAFVLWNHNHIYKRGDYW